MKIFAFALLLVICVIARSPMPYDSEVLEIFNRERHLAGVPNLTFSTDLADKAQEYANRCNSSLSATKGVGEIVIRGFGVSEADAPKLMAALLVAEGRDWNCTTDVCISGACTHHRQIIWETTTEVGCGFSHCGTKGYQLVCRFTTFGNLYNTHPLANHGCPSGSKKRYGGGGGGRGWGSGGLGSSCLSGWGNSGWGNSKTTSSWSTSSQPSGWGSPSGSPSGNSWDSSSSPSPSPSPSGWGGSPSGNSWSTSSGGWNGNGGSGELSQGGWRLSQTSTDATALTNNELWAFWYTQGRKIVVDPGFVSHVDGTIIPVPGGSLQVISWQDQVLEVHNAERASYGLPPLKWDGALAAGAQEFSTNCDIKLSGIRGLGENIAIGSGPVDKANVPKLLTALWTSEVFDWNCTTDKCTSDFCSHHRQIIWDETTKVGCGFSSCGTQGHILVCRYDPAGNTRGRHPLQSHGLDACTVQPNQENSTKRYGGGGSWGSSAGCGGLLASCLNGYGLISTQSSGWGSSSSPSSDSWGSSDSSSWGSPSGSWSSSNNEGSSSGWRQSGDSSGWTNSWGSVGSAINAVPSWLSQYTSVVSGAANAVSAAAAGVKESVNQVKDAVNNVQQAGAGSANAGNADAGNADAGNADAGNADAGNANATNADAGNADTGNADPADAGNADPAQKRSMKKRTWGATSNPSGGWGSSNVWGGHSSSTESCASPSSGWSNQPASSSFSGGWRIGYGGGSSSSGSSWSKGSAGSSSSWSSSPSSSSSSSWSSSSSTSSCSALQDTNSGWPGGSAGWTAPSSSWSSSSSGWRITTGQGEVVASNNPVFQWWTLDGRSVRIDPGFTSDEEGNINANDGEPVSSVQYIGALPKTTAIAVIVVCSVCGVLLVAVVVVFLVKRRPSSMETA